MSSVTIADRLLETLASGPSYGAALAAKLGVHHSGVYVALSRLVAAGKVESFWVREDPGRGRPTRRYYRLAQPNGPTPTAVHIDETNLFLRGR